MAKSIWVRCTIKPLFDEMYETGVVWCFVFIEAYRFFTPASIMRWSVTSESYNSGRLFRLHIDRGDNHPVLSFYPLKILTSLEGPLLAESCHIPTAATVQKPKSLKSWL